MGRVYKVYTGTSPTAKTPVEGGGSWIVNFPSAYYLGRAMLGTEFEWVHSSMEGWHYGRSLRTNIRGWILPNSINFYDKSDGRKIRDTFSAESRHQLKNRESFGKWFNAPPGTKKFVYTETGTPTAVRHKCPFYYNYFFSNHFHSGYFRDMAGDLLPTPETVKPEQSPILYRYTTLDLKAVVLKHPVFGWGFAEAACVDLTVGHKVFKKRPRK